jgi:tetratricopeptide (TPR) repeat protein
VANRLRIFLRRGWLSGSLVAIFGTLLSGTVSAQQGIDDLRTRIERGYEARDLASIEAARVVLLGLTANPGSRPEYEADLGYYAAYARFRQALAVPANRALAQFYLEDCIAELRTVVALQPGHAEAHALLGSCYGMSTLYSVLATVTRGLEARRQMALARRLAPDNPWVVMQDGLADWATPRLVGGDRELALTKLERAAGLFTQAVTTGSEAAAWGAAEAWQQLGLRYRELGRVEAAEAALARATALTALRLQVAAAGP